MNDDYTIETDQEAETRRRSGAIDHRYHVVHPRDGLIEAFPTLGEAFARGARWDRPEKTGYPPYEVEVYDSMARKGKARTWRHSERTGVIDMMRDRFGAVDLTGQSSLWKCVETRPL